MVHVQSFFSQNTTDLYIVFQTRMYNHGRIQDLMLGGKKFSKGSGDRLRSRAGPGRWGGGAEPPKSPWF